MTLDDVVELALRAGSFKDFQNKLYNYRLESRLEQEAADKFAHEDKDESQ